MPKQKKTSSNTQRGRWKQNIRARGKFIRRALSLTLASNREIADRAGLKITNPIITINKNEGIRPPPEMAKGIEGTRKSDILKKRVRKDTRKKIGFFKTEAEKWAVIKKYNDLIEEITGKWWRSEPVKSAFGRKRKDFLKEVKLFVFKQLDYFDPGKKTKKNEPAKIELWIKKGIEIISKSIYFDEKRASEKQKNLVSKRASGMAEPFFARNRVPATAKPLLKKLGLRVNDVAELGYGDIKQQIIKISEQKKTGLSQRQKKVVKMRLEEKTLDKIAASLGFRSKGLFSECESDAAKKIKARMEKL